MNDEDIYVEIHGVGSITQLTDTPARKRKHPLGFDQPAQKRDTRKHRKARPVSRSGSGRAHSPASR
jgi:hypothetical protein